MSTQELLIAFFKGAKEEIKIDPSLIGDITVGTFYYVLLSPAKRRSSRRYEPTGMVLPPKAPYDARASAIAAGFPDSVPVQVINR